ncbi:MAG TPA: UDP-N-acetylmuramoyl-L-alanyl-D-glutamate--2,6-diaminopimelate ligase [Burkholderiaceae bacterium]|nr:UDP-N-acetylmuramoyl-L-alanyl-D-glutamate--2,6-diaminopimelate ligase [Burkholderiaceae bacterium]
MAATELATTTDAAGWLAQRGVRGLSTDSRRITAGDAFLAWPGHAVDGRRFVPQALAAGAIACLVEADGAAAFDALDTASVATLHGLKARAGLVASDFWGAPSERLAVVAVTGTNGKTSTTWWLAQALGALGRRCGVIGTLGIGEPPRARAAGGEPPRDGAESAMAFTGMTTPDAVTVQAGFKRFVDSGLAACAIEATSIGIAEHRLAGTAIDVALFTNFTQDHLDYHGSMDAYWDAKARLFAWPGLRAAVVNVDDPQGARLARSLQDTALELWTYSTRRDARLRASAIGYHGGGLGFELHEGAERAVVRTRMIGDYNVGNLLATIGGLRACGVPLADAAAACAGLSAVPGRMERIAVEGDAGASLPQVVVDYAHTPDALEKALLALQPFAAERGGALWCVFGCGGNRDATKRPLMGAIAQRLAQQVVVTSDNPRGEAPAFIVLQIVAGLTEPPGRRDAAAAPRGGQEDLGRPGVFLVGSQEHVRVIEDRRAAIAHAVRRADARDVVLIAGKGHEDYQEIAGVKHPFSDLAEAARALRERAERAA